ncbi:MAG: DUF4867 family protein [Lachnospiraceae bacterium]|nr:DUF4867 family protein [Lachnospiraceae bacterium]MBR5916494.1 DUF4867 family protein [Lachnospiraceae bacterium]MBR6382981.1 DUF4867 family protein [Lachnospiraceae bacterium]
MEIKKVTDPSFKKYGKIIEGIDFSEILKNLEALPMPAEGVEYFPGVEALECTPATQIISESLYGGMPIQIGMCNGHNKALNAVEYHRDSEINVALYDMVLLIGELKDVTEDFKYDTSKIEAFLVPAGVAVEMYATTLHYAPCHVEDQGFKAVVVLPKGTNYDLTFKNSYTKEDKLLTAVNKWLIAHEDAKIDGAFNGLVGENITI